MIVVRYNIYTDFWGPMFWYSIHSSAFLYDPKNKNAFKEWYKILPHVLPCSGCRKHCMEAYDNGMSPKDKDFKDAESLFKYTYKLHSYVNKCLKKKNPSFNNVRSFYEKSIIERGDKFYGPVFWHMIHSVSWSYSYSPSDKDKIIYTKWMELTINDVYPGKSTIHNLKVPSDMVKNRDTLLKWTYHIHSSVNKSLGKYKSQPSFDTYVKFYNTKMAQHKFTGAPIYMGVYSPSSSKNKET